MFRLSPFKNNSLSEVETKVTMAVTTEDNGKLVDKFYTLALEIDKINSLALSWTIVHPITQDSPLYGMTKEEIASTDIEIMVFIKGFDEVFSNNVVARTSYVSSEIIWGAKFNIIYHPSEDKMKTVLAVDRVNDFSLVHLPDIHLQDAANL